MLNWRHRLLIPQLQDGLFLAKKLQGYSVSLQRSFESSFKYEVPALSTH
jgi:hypothetical protein